MFRKSSSGQFIVITAFGVGFLLLLALALAVPGDADREGNKRVVRGESSFDDETLVNSPQLPKDGQVATAVAASAEKPDEAAVAADVPSVVVPQQIVAALPTEEAKKTGPRDLFFSSEHDDEAALPENMPWVIRRRIVKVDPEVLDGAKESTTRTEEGAALAAEELDFEGMADDGGDAGSAGEMPQLMVQKK